MTTTTPAPGYKHLLAPPGRTWFVTATAIGRMPSAMKALACVLLVQQLTGSYGLAGLVGAAQTLVSAFASPQLARLIDRHGEKPVLFWAMMAHIIGVIALIASAYSGLPDWSMLIGAGIIGGSSVQFGSLSRARWASEVGRGAALDKAYAMESMIDEMGFVVGPMLVVPLCVEVHPAAGIVASMIMTIIGTVMLIRARGDATDSVHLATADAFEDGARPVILIPGIFLIALSFIFMGILFGATEIVIVAFTEHQGNPSAASYVAATFACGSLLGAVLYGARTWHGDPRPRMLIAFWWISLGSIPILIAPSILWMALAVFVTGLAISPGMIIANSFAEQIAPPRKLTETFAWLGSSMATGAAIGSILAGRFVDEVGIRGGQWTAVVGGLACGIIVTLGWRWFTVERNRSYPVG